MLTLVLLSLSDPARSTRFSLERVYSALECVRERDWEEREGEGSECNSREKGRERRVSVTDGRETEASTLTSTWMVKMQ